MKGTHPRCPRGSSTSTPAPARAFSRASAAFANTRLGRFLSIHVLWKVDPWLMRADARPGRDGHRGPHRAARDPRREERRAAAQRVIYFHDGDRVTIVASKLGLPQHPAWFHNLRAHPEVTFGGIPMRAKVVAGEAERERLWALADRVFAPYATYRREAAEAGREIPIVQLSAALG